MQPQSTLVLTSQAHEDGKIIAALTEMPLPEPAENELVIAVEAAPINPSDLGGSRSCRWATKALAR